MHGIELKISHTTFIMKLKGYSKTSVLDLLETENFSKEIKGEVHEEDDIVYLTIFSQKDRERTYGKTKENFIKSVSNICNYISVIYDSETTEYMKSISESVYNLEREFRFLIEYVFLKKYGENWYKKFFKDSSKEYDRSVGRSEVIGFIDNPLDNRNFVDLKNFVEEDILISKNTMVEKLNNVEELLSNYRKKGENLDSISNNVLELLSEIKDLSEFRSSKVSSLDIYNHITPEIAAEWQTLYSSYRNLWAHNYCLMTQSELKEYQALSTQVLTKIRTEITLLSLLFEKDTLSYPEQVPSSISISLTQITKTGVPICKLGLNIDTEEKRFILEINEATYKDLLNVLSILADQADCEEALYHLKLVQHNPFLKEKVKSIAEEILTNPVLHEKLKYNFFEVEKSFKSFNKSYLFYELDKPSAIKKDDLNSYLKKIHNEFKTISEEL